ncbi:MAG TPA: tRNA pseudouridine(38-40) synthase TruA [Smithella sp.]|nr:tRNA pseudouridine(38-40) synthase TruA [Smithella sp.]MDM7988087.1 tRNA pseudouridine(38-40) synthase TruA [Smithella sp.]HNY49256.1 tRNA pseudouridine(38-40) synthase TruA [Smithella sp.]HOG88943.1 tRNA pseudouridine(38-40) synthase TruA [Smithella sp.]HOU49701.1 tRNA pseudouridine(38-40) synthase TruA [Smithella sp.]
MNKYKIVLEYDGTNYRGWQSQKNARSVQDTLIDAAEKFLGTPVTIQGAGRTDAGVHALGQVAHLEASRKIHPDSLRMGINDNLPASVNILKVENASASFHARHHAVSRSYLYLISRRRTAFGKRYVWWVKDKLDAGKMKQALDVFQGFHDFASFADKKMDKDTSTKVNIEGIWLKEFDDIIALRILGSHFLWKMVRRIVGVIVEVGRGNISRHDVEKMLTSFSELPAHFTAPPSGLFLEKVLYEGDHLPAMKPPICLF